MEVEREADHRYSPGYPKDLLQRFADGSSLNEKPEPAAGKVEGVSDEIELSLGLSSNGSFGVDPKRTKLIRSSSASLPRELDFAITTAAAAAAPLTRTCSLPAESEEEQRKRKELQSLKRLEAKRKRSEKRRSAARPDEHAGAPPPIWRPGGGGAAVGGQYPPPVRQGSIGSQCSSSSCASDLDGRQAAARGGDGDERRQQQQLRRTKSAEMERKLMEEMPCVTTRGEGPNGRRIEGFLYKYRKGEEVRIVCVCHGSFLTPAEFVRHAGGGEVAHPLRHIVVSSSPSAI